MNKNKIAVLVVMVISVIILSSCSKHKTLEKQLDDLENIIEKYEPKFKSIGYGTKEYTQMITEYNKEIFDWADEFEDSRYEKDSDSYKRDISGNRVPTPEFKEVKSRFYELNNRMTRMVLAGIPKTEEPDGSERKSKENQEK